MILQAGLMHDDAVYAEKTVSDGMFCEMVKCAQVKQDGGRRKYF